MHKSNKSLILNLNWAPDNIENPVFGFCSNNACIICPVKEFYGCFPAKDNSNESYEINIGTPEIIVVLQLKKIYK